MAININDPRVSFDGKRFLVDGIPIRLWLKNVGISHKTVSVLQSEGKSITQIENMYKGKKQRMPQKRLISYMGKEWTIPELFRSGMCHESVSIPALRNRLNNKWDIKRALTEPTQIRKGTEVCYEGKTYSSVSILCRELKIDETFVRNLLKAGESLKDAIDHVFSFRPSFVIYKGESIQISELVRHPDNIHNLDYRNLHSRIRTLGHKPEDALASPVATFLKEEIIYKGTTYKNKLDLCRTLKLSFTCYQNLSGVDVNTAEFNEMVDKMVQNTNKHLTLK